MVITFCVASDVPTADVEAVLIRTLLGQLVLLEQDERLHREVAEVSRHVGE